MSRAFLLLVIYFFGFNIAEAKPLYFNRLKNFYSDSSEISSRRCQNCHVGASLRLNPFGQDFGMFLGDFESREEFFEALGELDSDEDGISNRVEIFEGTHPGKVED